MICAGQHIEDAVDRNLPIANKSGALRDGSLRAKQKPSLRRAVLKGRSVAPCAFDLYALRICNVLVAA
jgi:hypothetical protein